VLNTRAEQAHSTPQGVCSICGSESNIEMHHVRGLKDLKGRDRIGDREKSEANPVMSNVSPNGTRKEEKTSSPPIELDWKAV
jgi:hypothetical protein